MLEKHAYESLMRTFLNDFDDKYTESRISLIYSMINKLTPKDTHDLMVELLCRYNKHQLPTPKEFITLAYIMYPFAKKESKRLTPHKIRVV
jgi:hypothetical protein